MARFLSVLLVLLASIQVSLSIHFTNTEWNIQQDQEFLLQWVYDGGDPTDSSWFVVIWLNDGQHPLDLSDPGFVVYNASRSANTTSYKFQPTCDTVKIGAEAFGIAFEQGGYQVVSTSYSPVWTIEGWYAACSPPSPLSKGAKIAIGVSMAWLGICLLTIAFFYLRGRIRNRPGVGVKPVTATTPNRSVELENRVHEEAVVPQDGDTGPPPYAPRT